MSSVIYSIWSALLR